MKTLKFAILSIFCVAQLSLLGSEEDIRIPKIKQKCKELVSTYTPLADVTTDIALEYIDIKEIIKNQEELFDAISRLDFEKMKKSIDKGADVNSDYNIYLSSSLNSIIDHFIYNSQSGAGFKTLLPFIEYLLNHGANINEQSNNSHYKTGYTILMHICEKKDQDKESAKFVEFFLEKGANPDLIDKDGETALIKAARYGNYEIVKMLADYYKANNSPTMLQQYRQAFDTEKNWYLQQTKNTDPINDPKLLVSEKIMELLMPEEAKKIIDPIKEKRRKLEKEIKARGEALEAVEIAKQTELREKEKVKTEPARRAIVEEHAVYEETAKRERQRLEEEQREREQKAQEALRQATQASTQDDWKDDEEQPQEEWGNLEQED